MAKHAGRMYITPSEYVNNYYRATNALRSDDSRTALPACRRLRADYDVSGSNLLIHARFLLINALLGNWLSGS